MVHRTCERVICADRTIFTVADTHHFDSLFIIILEMCGRFSTKSQGLAVKNCFVTNSGTGIGLNNCEIRTKSKNLFDLFNMP
jgi:hypothetical protein